MGQNGARGNDPVIVLPTAPRTRGYVLKYLGFIGYGIHASIKGVATISDTTSADWAFLWPVLVSVFAALALVGVVRSKYRGRPALEMIATAILLAHLCTYSVYIIIRAYAEGDGFTDAASAWLPVLLCIFPFERIAAQWRGVNLPAWLYRIVWREGRGTT